SRVWNPRELLAYGTAQSLGSAPGTAFSDSGTGYLMLGLALENASRASAADLYADYVAEPLGLTDTELAATSMSTLHGFRSVD
ncbi:serine hydrolase, partial [Rhizobium johnstonii]